MEDKLADARASLAEYRPRLEDIYGGKLRLHTYAVVGVGFERLVWEKM